MDSSGPILMTEAVNNQPNSVCSFNRESVSVDDVVAALVRDGGCFVRNFMSKEDAAAIEREIRPYLDMDQPLNGDFFPKETRKVCGLAGKSPTFIKVAMGDSVYQQACERLLSSHSKSWYGGECMEHISKPILNAHTVFSISPGARAQALHRDDSIHHNVVPAISREDYRVGRDTAIGLFMAGKKTTQANGATRFVPKSHLQHTWDPPSEEGVVYAEMEPGDAFIMLASCYHGGSANTTENEERLLFGCFMCKGYLRQEENMPLAVPTEKIAQYPTEIQAKLGYDVSAPYLGWVDLRSPLEVLFGKESLTAIQ
ncbi:uncharacterized protein PV07_03433 [Cladophialophora immunda]|uniref:Phytanoyl-CoA dioxygenase n=1 Tax=Cladophialophora immunda TaxID=569365 RepID=A0A0D2CP94_9EURO|nr:uncharacterized protein PV07_03433 [Cladophialophora immunda]KIW31840.1 hypothetical protein PV07_03433 [Cladophialophora immunda]OQU98449.1 hypothetical protein CLAIMM_04236 [Cladophialophora immunda]